MQLLLKEFNKKAFSPEECWGLDDYIDEQIRHFVHDDVFLRRGGHGDGFYFSVGPPLPVTARKTLLAAKKLPSARWRVFI